MTWRRVVPIAVIVLSLVVASVSIVLYPRLHPTPSAAEVAAQLGTPEPMPTFKGPPVVVFIGDSYTAGAGVDVQQERFINILSVHEGWVPVNLGSGGTGYMTTNGKKGCGLDFCPTYEQTIFAAQKVKPDLIVVSGGRNDLGKPGVQLKAAVNRFYADLRSAFPTTKILVTSPIFDDDSPPAQIYPLRANVRTAATRIGATYLDLGDPLLGHQDLIVTDGVHPNTRGHELLARVVEQKVDALKLHL